MTRKKVWRYYCEFCRKSGCSGGHLKRHEQSCTLNPNRTCRMCEWAEWEQQPTNELLTAFDGYAPPENRWDHSPDDAKVVARLEALANECPACMLAAVRIWAKRFGGECFLDVGWKKRREAFINQMNENAMDDEACRHAP